MFERGGLNGTVKKKFPHVGVGEGVQKKRKRIGQRREEDRVQGYFINVKKNWAQK